MDLEEVRDMDDSNKIIQEQFLKWLSNQLTPAQMSEIYITYYDIDAYLKKEKILSSSLLETVDVEKISDIKNMIAKNGKFRYAHRNRIDKYTKAIGYYYDWISSNQKLINKMTQQNVSALGDRVVYEKSDDTQHITEEVSKSEFEVKYVDFEDKVVSYAFTTVEYVEYFGKRVNNIRSWKKLYSVVMKFLYEDYPIEIARLKGVCIGNGKRIDIGDGRQSAYMTAPRRFAEDMYVETNLNATNIIDKIRWLLASCRVDSENLLIAYSVKNGKEVQTVESKEDTGYLKKDSDEKNNEELLIKNSRRAFINWLYLIEKKQGEVLCLLTQVSALSKLAVENRIIDKDLYLIENPVALKMISERLRRNSNYLKLSSKLQSQFDDALEIYVQYKMEQIKTNTEKRDVDSIKNEDIQDNSEPIFSGIVKLSGQDALSENDKNFITILKEDFENGFRINSAIDKGRFKVFYNEKFEKELSMTDDCLVATLKKIGEIRDNRIYVKLDMEQNDLMNRIYEDVLSVLEQGASCAYIDSIYQRYQFDLADKLQIYDSEVLGEQLIKMSKGRLRKKQTFLCFQFSHTDLEKDVLNIMKQSPIPMSYDDFRSKMWYVPLEKIKHVLVVTKSIVQVAPETYFYALNFPVNQEEIMEIIQIIRQVLESKSYITDIELRKYIDERCPGISLNTAEFTTYGFRNCLGYILRDTYSFHGPIISGLGKELSMAEVFTGYCNERVQVTITELKKLSSDMNSIIYWDAVRNEMIRVSEELFLRSDQIDFDVDRIDDVLESFCADDYVPIKDIGLFMHFPSLNVQWNGYVLESFVYNHSRKFRLLHASFSASGYFGAVVRMDSSVCDYRTLIIDALSDTEQWSDKKTALEWLVKKGYQQRKHYADIEKVVHEAKLLRENKNKTKK